VVDEPSIAVLETCGVPTDMLVAGFTYTIVSGSVLKFECKLSYHAAPAKLNASPVSGSTYNTGAI
jgi:hypothetical protein